MQLPTTTIALALTTALSTTALPTTPTDKATTYTSPLFTLNMTLPTGGGSHPLLLIRNGTSPKSAYILRAITSLSALQKGTPAYYTGTGEYHNLYMTINDDETYGLEAPQVGDDYGYAGAVFGVLEGHQKQWVASATGVSHELQAALNALYACKDHANGEPGYFLKFGTPQSPDLYPPVGCDPTVLTPDFDIEKKS